jgi:hypothetical protein
MSNAYFSAIMESERLALVKEQRLAGMPSYSAVGDLATICNTPTPLRRQHPVNLEALGDGSFIQVCPSLGYRSLWTHVTNDGYRDSYARFLATSSAAPIALPSDLHVDHLYNRERARAFGLTYIRMVLLPNSINTSHGAGYEKRRTHGPGVEQRSRKIDTIMLMKLFGFRSPPVSGRVTPELIGFANLVAPMIGATPNELVTEVMNLLEVSRFKVR